VVEPVLDKKVLVESFIDAHHLSLKKSIGIGDTESDISFLQMVQEPICFNPNSHLYEIAKKKGWKVVVERKDVIYEL
jgi:phosphoserine phosphatase